MKQQTTSPKQLKPTASHRKIARALSNGESIKSAYALGGLSEKQAKKGWSDVLQRSGLRAALRIEFERKAAIGEAFPPELRAAVVRGHLREKELPIICA